MLRVYWPDTGGNDDQWLVGFEHRTDTLTTLTITHQCSKAVSSLKELQIVIDRLCTRLSMQSVWACTHAPPIIVGQLLHSTTTAANVSDNESDNESDNDSDNDGDASVPLIVKIDGDSGLPQLVRYRNQSVDVNTVQFILYDARTRTDFTVNDPSHAQPRASSDGGNVSDLSRSLSQLNARRQIADELGKVGSQHTAAPLTTTIPSTGLTLLVRTVEWILSVVQFVLRMVQLVVTARVPSFLSSFSAYPVAQPRLIHLSTFASQLSYKLSQLLTMTSLTSTNTSTSIAPLVSFAMDLLLGSIAYHLLVNHESLILSSINRLSYTLHSEVIDSYIHWFQSEPVGLKLNSQLNEKLGIFIQQILLLRNYYSGPIVGHASAVYQLLAQSSVCGLSICLSLTSDLFALLTCHFDLIHWCFALVYRVIKSLLYSLWQLFHGNKYNVLRARIDRHTYTQPQFLFGVLLFIVLLFLFPTVLIYYWFFTGIKFLITGAHAVIWWCLATMQCCPWMALTMYCYNKQSMTSGVRFALIDCHSDSQLLKVSQPPPVTCSVSDRQLESIKDEMMGSLSSTDYFSTRYHHQLVQQSYNAYRASHSYLRLVACPVSVRALFAEYRRTLWFIQRHYTAKALVSAVIHGRRLPTPPPPSSAAHQ